MLLHCHVAQNFAWNMNHHFKIRQTFRHLFFRHSRRHQSGPQTSAVRWIQDCSTRLHGQKGDTILTTATSPKGGQPDFSEHIGCIYITSMYIYIYIYIYYILYILYIIMYNNRYMIYLIISDIWLLNVTNDYWWLFNMSQPKIMSSERQGYPIFGGQTLEVHPIHPGVNSDLLLETPWGFYCV